MSGSAKHVIPVWIGRRSYRPLLVALFFAICSVGPVRAQTAAEGARHEGKKISWREVEWALKTNLLTDGVGAPGLEAEVVVAERFSAAAGVTYADVSAGAGRYKIQTFHGNIEGRYWFPRRQEMRREIRHETRPESRSEPRQGTQPETAGRPLTGWYAGVYAAHGGRYDVRWGGGWQGDGFFSAGVVAGYSMPLTGRLNLDVGVTGGYFFTPEARHYHARQEGHLVWQQTRYNPGRFAPTGVTFDLVWLLGGGRER